MASNYPEFPVLIRDENGVITNVGAGVTVKIRAKGAGADAAESPLTTDVDGIIAAGTLAAIAAGTRVFFRVENYNGLAMSIPQITT
jgi:hypothetical protein